jgi:terminase large subunit-like protein
VAIGKNNKHIVGLHTHQLEVFHSPARFRILAAGRRFGKTRLALAEMLHAAKTGGSNIWYVGPSYRQAKRIVWKRLKTLTRPFWAGRPSETDLRIEIVSGSTMTVCGADNPASLRGDGLDFVVLDECASLRPEVWLEICRPALTDRKGRALLIGTPKGRNHFYERFEYARTAPDWEAFHFTTAQGGNVDPAELTAASHEFDPDTYRQELEAEFTGAGRNRVYYAFDQETNVQPVAFDPYYPVVWSIDFNVNPMCMLLLQRIRDAVYVFDEIVLQPDANTLRACETVIQRLNPLYSLIPAHHLPLEFLIYGDASGNQRRTSGAATDWGLIREFFTLWKGRYNFSIRTTSINPAVRDRVNCVNSRLRSHYGDAHLFIDPKCRELIRDLEQVVWSVDATGQTTSDIDKSDRARTHSSDALGYYISQEFPLRGPAGFQSSGRLV